MNCKYHPDRLSTHIADSELLIPECDECAQAEREIGALNVINLRPNDNLPKGIVKALKEGRLTFGTCNDPLLRRATKTSEANPTLQANRQWLKANREKYRGQWVALRDGHLLGIASSLEDLTRTLSDTSNTLLTRA